MRFLTLFCLVFLSFNSMAVKANLCQEHQCIAIVDAGSTGSRLHLFTYDFNGNHEPTNITEFYSKKIKPGLAEVQLEEKKVNQYLDNLFLNAPEQDMPVRFYATGGMRLQSEEKQQLYMEIVKQWFSTNPQWKLLDARTITGTEEGIFGWLSVNYTTGKLADKNSSLTGLMDIGGASIQIVFPVQNPEEVAPQDRIEMNILGRHINLFAHSFLGLGMIEVAHKYENLAPCFATGYPLPNGATATGNAELCQELVFQGINNEYAVKRIVTPAIKNNIASMWYVLGAISSTIKQQPMLFEKGDFTPQALLNKASTKACMPQWETLQKAYPQNEYIFLNCLTSAYYYGLVVNGYEISPTQIINTLPTEKDTDWTLGVILRQ